MPEKTDSPKGHPAVLDTLECFFERIDDEPEHAAHLTEKSACEVADSLCNQNWRISLYHGRERWPYLSMGKRANFVGAEDAKALKRFDTMAEDPLHLAPMRLAGAFAINCFFAFMLFSAATSAL